MADRNKVIKQISVEIELAEYVHKDYETVDLSLLKDALSLLKSQPQIIRCKDCHYGISSTKNDIFCIKAIYADKYKRPDWFCADGEHK